MVRKTQFEMRVSILLASFPLVKSYCVTSKSPIIWSKHKYVLLPSDGKSQSFFSIFQKAETGLLHDLIGVSLSFNVKPAQLRKIIYRFYG